MADKILVLDLEGTLISSAVSQIPRPGLHAFLTECAKLFDRIVLMTTVREEVARPILQLLAAEGSAPAWLADIPYVPWAGKYKDLMLVPGFFDSALVLLLDDMPEYVEPDQAGLHVWISSYDPARSDEFGFAEVIEELRRRVRAAA
ncbi:MAG: NIF family HAD-type phosphatase [Hydrogenophaga sp.]|uniref:NIF family HAD-type phosphatase n=1 Tax=Hydrogenophaga sp. TaxID=1904254 RepID=UPI003D107327